MTNISINKLRTPKGRDTSTNNTITHGTITDSRQIDDDLVLFFSTGKGHEINTVSINLDALINQFSFRMIDRFHEILKENCS